MLIRIYLSVEYQKLTSNKLTSNISIGNKAMLNSRKPK